MRRGREKTIAQRLPFCLCDCNRRRDEEEEPGKGRGGGGGESMLSKAQIGKCHFDKCEALCKHRLNWDGLPPPAPPSPFVFSRSPPFFLRDLLAQQVKMRCCGKQIQMLSGEIAVDLFPSQAAAQQAIFRSVLRNTRNAITCARSFALANQSNLWK